MNETNKNDSFFLNYLSKEELIWFAKLNNITGKYDASAVSREEAINITTRLIQFIATKRFKEKHPNALRPSTVVAAWAILCVTLFIGFLYLSLKMPFDNAKYCSFAFIAPLITTLISMMVLYINKHYTRFYMQK